MMKENPFSGEERTYASELAVMSVGLDVYGLQEHMMLCQIHSGLSFNLKCALHRVQGFVFTRFITSVTGALLLLGVGYLLV